MKLVILLSATFLIAACGSSAENSGVNSNGAANTASNPAAAQANQNPANATNMIVVKPEDLANYNANTGGRVIVNNPTGEPIKPTAFPAPDYSEYTTVMNKDGLPVETRVFKNNAQIDKIVRSWKSPKEKKISVYLKSGKVVELDGDKLENINSVPVAAILEAVGLKPQNSAPETVKDTKQ
ncbi:MAG TPA: hypothetical protein VHL50_01625 [Pyrinomonadaceae bacterium]|nr:hypothetical protein [Pyrinomonadaceae bacterium]